MDDIPKRIKRALRELAGRAYDEELRRALLPLAEAFQRWQRGEVPSFELTEMIHKFHQGPARDLWVRYNHSMLTSVVAFAIANGIVDRTKVEPEVLQFLSSAIEFYEAEGRN